MSQTSFQSPLEERPVEGRDRRHRCGRSSAPCSSPYSWMLLSPPGTRKPSDRLPSTGAGWSCLTGSPEKRKPAPPERRAAAAAARAAGGAVSAAAARAARRAAALAVLPAPFCLPPAPPPGRTSRPLRRCFRRRSRRARCSRSSRRRRRRQRGPPRSKAAASASESFLAPPMAAPILAVVNRRSLLYSHGVASDRRAAELNERLPRGRHGLPREAVTESQRSRILQAMIEVVSERGYPETRVVDVIERRRRLPQDLLRALLQQGGLLPGDLRRAARQPARRHRAGLRVEAGSALGRADRRRPRRAARSTWPSTPTRPASRSSRCSPPGPKALARRDAALRQFTGFLDAGRAETSVELPGHHLALDRRRHQRAALQRDPARRRPRACRAACPT